MVVDPRAMPYIALAYTTNNCKTLVFEFVIDRAIARARAYAKAWSDPDPDPRARALRMQIKLEDF